MLRAAGIVALSKKLYQRLILHRGVHQANLMGYDIRFAVQSPYEIERIDDMAMEAEFIAQIVNAVRPGDVFLDVGANIGIISLLVAARGAAGGVIVHSFEPEPRNAAELRRSIALNHLENRVIVHELGLGDRAGDVGLHVSGPTGEGRHSILFARPGSQRIRIPIDTADQVVARLGCAPTMVKIDVEGAELLVLKGMSRLLQLGSVRDLFIEVHCSALEASGHSPTNVRELLSELGYVPVRSSPRGGELHEHYQKREDISARDSEPASLAEAQIC
jgi:FkbM family methyltransferase